MPTFTAAQHFFSSVPADQSPQRRRGYQTLFQTRGLSDEVVRAIEDRSQYTTAPGDPIKHQFYALPGSLFAISRSVALTELDEFGRKGRYLSHTLILDRAALHSLGDCPLDIFQQFRFVTRLEEVFAIGQSNVNEAPAVRLDIHVEWPGLAIQTGNKHTREILGQLGLFVWQSSRLIERQEMVALIGPEKDQLALLALLYLLAAPSQRPLLSFDTHAAGCDWGRGINFWVQGYPDQLDERPVHRIDASSCTTATNLLPSGNPPFAIWMIQEGLPGGLDGLIRKQIWAEQLENCIRQEQPAHPFRQADSIPEDFVETYAHLNNVGIARKWLTHLPKGLSTELLKGMEQRITSKPGPYLLVLKQGVQVDDINWFLLQELLALGVSPDRSDRAALERWFKSNGSPALWSLISLWEKDSRAWGKMAATLPIDEYEMILNSVLHWKSPPLAAWQLCVIEHLPAWMKIASSLIPPDEWNKTLAYMEKLGDTAIDYLANFVAGLHPAAQKEIARWLKDYPGPALHLRSQLGLPVPKERKFKLF